MTRAMRSLALTAASLAAAGSLYAQVNDSFADALSLPSSVACLIDDATAEPQEPQHIPNTPATHSLWWRFTPSQDEFVTIATTNSEFDTVLAVYTGDSLSSLVPVARNDDDVSLGNGWSRIRMKATAGVTYSVVADSVSPVVSGQLVLTSERRVLSAGEYPSNDAFAGADLLAGDSTGGTVSVSSNGYGLATAEIDEPDHGGRAASHSLWWTYTPTQDGAFALSTSGSTCNATCEAYQGEALAALARVGGVAGARTLTFPVAASTTYHIALDGDSEAGAMRFAWSFVAGAFPANDAFASASALWGASGATNIGSTLFATAEAGEPAHGDSAASRSLWWRYTAAQDGTLTVALADRTFNAVAAVYFGETLGTLYCMGRTDGAGGALQCPLMAGMTYAIAVDGMTADDFGTAQLQWSFQPADAPGNDNFAQAAELAASSGSSDVDTAHASSELGEPSHCGQPAHHSLWWSFTRATNGVLRIDTAGSTFDTVLALYAGSALGNLQPLVANDSAGDDVMTSAIEWTVAAGVTYSIALDGYAKGDSGPGRLNWSFTPASPNARVVTLTSALASGYPTNVLVTLGQPYGALPKPTVYGYAFGGWWTAAGGGGTHVTRETTVSIASNHALYAWLTPSTFHVTFDPSGVETYTQQVFEVTYAASWPLVVVPTLEGYRFNGWHTAEGTLVDLAAAVALAGDTTLFAWWTPAPETMFTTRGTPLAWLRSYGLTNQVSDLEDEADADGDGFAAWQEYVADTDPTNRDSCLALTSVRVGDGGVEIAWKGGSAATQWLEMREDLSASNGTWVAIFTNEPPTLSTALFVDPSAVTGARFYRIRVAR